MADAAAAFGSDTHRNATRMDLPDCDSYAVDAAALRSASWGRRPSPSSSGASAVSHRGDPSGSARSSPGGAAVPALGAVLGPEVELSAAAVLFCLRAALGVRRAGSPGYPVWARQVLCGGCGVHLGLSITQLGRLRGDSTAACIRCAAGSRCKLPAPGCRALPA